MSRLPRTGYAMHPGTAPAHSGVCAMTSPRPSTSAAASGISRRSVSVRATALGIDGGAGQDREAVLAIPEADQPHRRIVPGQPLAEPADRLGGGVGVERDYLGVMDHKAHRLAMVVFVVRGHVDDHRAFLHAKVADALIQEPRNPFHQ